MKVSELSDAELSLMIAEQIEPKPTEISPPGVTLVGFAPESGLGSGVFVSPVACWRRTEFSDSWQPRDMIGDPAMTVMLIERLLVNDRTQSSLGRIVAEAYALVHCQERSHA